MMDVILDYAKGKPAEISGPAWTTAALLALSAMALGAAVNVRDGMGCTAAFGWLHVAVMSGLVGVWLIQSNKGWCLPRNMALTAIGLMVAFQIGLLCTSYPGTIWNAAPDDPYHRKELSQLKDQRQWIKDPAQAAAADQRIGQLQTSLNSRRFPLTVLLAAGLGVVSLLPHRWARAGLPMMLGAHFALGAWMIQQNPHPYIDVHVFQQESCRALGEGRNPYGITFPNIYGPKSVVYGKDIQKENRVEFGFPYMPLSLLMALPGYVVGGDHRYSQLAAITLAAALIAYCRPGAFGTLATMLLLFTPRLLMVVELGWTEPFVVVLLAGVLFCACRFPRATPYALGLLLASKQYMVLLVPVIYLLAGQDRTWRQHAIFLGKALVVAAVVSLPLALWNPGAFWRSAVTLQFQQPFREDSLSYLAYVWWSYQPSRAWLARLSWLAFLAAAVAIVLAWRRCPRSPGGFAAAAAIIFMAFLILSKQAFCNYYFMVIGALCCAVAALGGESATIAGRSLANGSDSQERLSV